eukprot:g1257.t1
MSSQRRTMTLNKSFAGIQNKEKQEMIMEKLDRGSHNKKMQINPIAVSMQNNFHSYHYKSKRRLRVLSKSLPSLNNGMLRHKKTERNAFFFQPMSANEEALIEHIFDLLCDENKRSIQRSSFLTALKFNKEIKSLVKGSKRAKGSKRLKYLMKNEDFQKRFIFFKTRQAQNMELDELLIFLGEKRNKRYQINDIRNKFNSNLRRILNDNKSQVIPPIPESSMELKRTVTTHRTHLISLRRKLINIIRYNPASSNLPTRIRFTSLLVVFTSLFIA